MARINGSVTQHAEAYEYYIIWSESNVNQSKNTSSVTATSYIKCKDHTAWANNKTQNLWINGKKFSKTLNISLSEGKTVTLVTGTVDNIQHNSDGSLKIEISASGELPDGSGYGPKYGSAKATVSLTKIPRAANFNSISIEDTDIDEFTMHYKVDKSLSSIQYKLNNDSWKNVDVVDGDWKTEATIKISNLNPNTSYKVQLKAVCNGVTTTSSSYTAKTQDIGKFSSLNNFEFGDKVDFSKTNPSNNENYMSVFVNNKSIISNRLIEENSGIIEWTQEELDELYKAMSSFVQDVVFNLITKKDSKSWTSSKTVKCNMTGNAKTIHYFTSDSVSKRGKLYYFTADKVSKKAILVIKKDGKWRRCI